MSGSGKAWRQTTAAMAPGSWRYYARPMLVAAAIAGVALAGLAVAGWRGLVIALPAIAAVWYLTRED